MFLCLMRRGTDFTRRTTLLLFTYRYDSAPDDDGGDGGVGGDEKYEENCQQVKEGRNARARRGLAKRIDVERHSRPLKVRRLAKLQAARGCDNQSSSCCSGVISLGSNGLCSTRSMRASYTSLE